MNVTVRALRADDTSVLAVVEKLASEGFRDVGYPNVADDEPFSVDEIGAYADDARGWVAVDDTGDAVGYVLVDVVDGNAHVEQVTVHPAWQGTGIGRLLLGGVTAWARAHGMPSVTLTTFTDVPWNRPLYEHLGFVVMTEDEIGPELRALREVEAAQGLDPAARVCMRRFGESEPRR